MPISGKGVVCYSGEMLRKLSLENPTCYVPGFAIIQHFPIYVFCEPCVCVCVWSVIVFVFVGHTSRVSVPLSANFLTLGLSSCFTSNS